MEPEMWLEQRMALMDAFSDAVPPTWRNGSSTFTMTLPKRVSSPIAGGERNERLTGVMLQTELRQPKTLMLAGDWHGDLPWAFKAIHYANSRGVDTILHVGDFGWWAPTPAAVQYLAQVNQELEHFGIDLLWVDGNHEDHSFWDQYNRPESLPFTAMSSKRITHLPRGFRWEWWGDTWMALGGAYSVDRSFGTEGQTWWLGETLNQDQLNHAKRPGKVDIIVAHDAPSNAEIPGIDPDKDLWLRINGKPRKVPSTDLLRANLHREQIQYVCDAVQPVEFYHGHYHRAYEKLARIKGGGYVNVRGLDMNGTTMEKNTHIITEGLNG